VRDMVFGCMEHHTWNYMWGRGRLDIETITDQITDIICHGILASNRSTTVQRESDRLAGLVDQLQRLVSPHTGSEAADGAILSSGAT